MFEAAPGLLPLPAPCDRAGAGGRLLPSQGVGRGHGALITAAERRGWTQAGRL